MEFYDISIEMIKLTKQLGRIEALENRAKISPGRLREKSEMICEKLFSHFNVEGKTISLYLPIEDKQEIDTYLILEKAISLNAKMAIPKANFENLELTHRVYEGISQLELSEYGIPEPKDGKLVRPAHFDIVIVPLLICDKRGYRVGYGKGFYDRFLKKCGPQTQFIGLSFFEPIDEILDVNEHDIRLHACITPEEIYRF